MQNKIKELSEKYPDCDVFFDGDEYAICSRKKGRGDDDGISEL